MHGVLNIGKQKREIGVFTLAEEANCVFTLLFVTLWFYPHVSKMKLLFAPTLIVF